MIEIKNLNKSYGDLRVLNDISVDIKKGEARCISNIIVENKANLSIKSGSLLCVIKEN